MMSSVDLHYLDGAGHAFELCYSHTDDYRLDLDTTGANEVK